MPDDGTFRRRLLHRNSVVCALAWHHFCFAGVWTKDLREKSNVPQSQLQKVLNLLEKRALIKGVKSIQAGARKMYMLADLTPAKEITGGAWWEGIRAACVWGVSRIHGLRFGGFVGWAARMSDAAPDGP